MDTAPRDGTLVDLWVIYQDESGSRYADSSFVNTGMEGPGWYFDYVSGRGRIDNGRGNKVTHWRLPPAPPPPPPPPITPQERMKQHIEAMCSARGGFSKKDLASLGIPYPPPKGWKKRLIREAK